METPEGDMNRTPIVSFAALLFSAHQVYARAPSCTDLATNPAYGLAGNPVITSASASIVQASGNNKAYCNVQLTYSARSGPNDGYDDGQAQAIKVGVGLPLSSRDGGTGGVQGDWNGKLQNLGGGVCAGAVGATTSATNAGYAGSSTDGGHSTAENGQGCDWGVIQSKHILNTGKIRDFFYESLAVQVRWTRKLARHYYSRPENYNYWTGCSTGGRQGLSLAQRYKDLGIDGYVIGAPAIYWQAFRLADDWPLIVIRDKLAPKGKGLTPGQITAANSAAVAACDVLGHDKVQDGIIDDSRRCNFNARNLICGTPGAPGAPNCLDADQAAAVNKIWDGPRNRFGNRIWFPYDRGIDQWFIASALRSTAQVMNWNHRDLSFDDTHLFTDQASVNAAGNPPGAMTYENEAALGSQQVGDLTEVQDPDLTAVRDAGAKIIMWHGTSDNLIRWRHSMDYYRRVATFFGEGEADFTSLQSWFRYFRAPGVGHCGGGPGPNPNASLLPALENWVENGVAPDQLLASGGSVSNRTRPLCPYPKTAIYRGTGDINVAANYFCGGNLEIKRVVCDSVRTKYKRENRSELDYASQGITAADCQ
jgi:hypothetical protein